MKTKLLTLMALTFPLISAADHHGPGPSAPVETWSCTLKAGKTLEDVRKVGRMVADVGQARNDPLAQWLFTPFTGEMSEGRFILMTGWPSFASMGTSFQGFFGEGAGDEIMAAWLATASCDSRNLYTAETLHNTIE